MYSRNRPEGRFKNPFFRAIFKYNMNKLIEYFKGSIAEMKKVVWPSKKQTTTYTLIVIGMSIGIALFLGLLDYLFNIGLEVLIK